MDGDFGVTDAAVSQHIVFTHDVGKVLLLAKYTKKQARATFALISPSYAFLQDTPRL